MPDHAVCARCMDRYIRRLHWSQRSPAHQAMSAWQDDCAVRVVLWLHVATGACAMHERHAHHCACGHLLLMKACGCMQHGHKGLIGAILLIHRRMLTQRCECGESTCRALLRQSVFRGRTCQRRIRQRSGLNACTPCIRTKCMVPKLRAYVPLDPGKVNLADLEIPCS